MFIKTIVCVFFGLLIYQLFKDVPYFFSTKHLHCVYKKDNSTFILLLVLGEELHACRSWKGKDFKCKPGEQCDYKMADGIKTAEKCREYLRHDGVAKVQVIGTTTEFFA